jgi:predicted ATPase
MTPHNDVQRFFVLTGGPGSGKTSLIEALERAGYQRSVEAGRAIIQDQLAIGGRALPWSDPLLFAELMLNWEMRSHRLAEQQSGTVFFDRGVPDVIGYLRTVNMPVPEHMRKAAALFRYHRRVFITPPWREIFHADQERKQSFDEAVRTYQAMRATYAENGYELVELPCASLEERVRFMMEIVGATAI